MSSENAKENPAPRAAADTAVVAESDILARLVLAQYLRECGYEVLEAATSEDVLALFRSGRKIDVILLDAQISGGLAGFTLTRQIREKYPDTEIVLTFGIVKAAEKAGEICDQGPLERPYHPQEIVKRIKRLRRNRASKP
ncbi:MAG TPA: response regulator [Rhizomicrobium sp.]|nr:response regulator [Rhizomicrobium sp.]